MQTRRILAFRRAPHRQRGVVATLIALIVLVITLMAVVALMHSVDTANTVAGSLAFRQAVLQEAERAYGEAKKLTYYSPPAGNVDDPSNGYYASVQPASSVRADIPNVLYLKTSGKYRPMPGSTSGNAVSYVIERLCPTDGAATLTTCIVPGKALTGGTSSNTTSDPGIPFNTTGSAAAYRLTVRVDGPKNAVAFVQTMLR